MAAYRNALRQVELPPSNSNFLSGKMRYTNCVPIRYKTYSVTFTKEGTDQVWRLTDLKKARCFGNVHLAGYQQRTHRLLRFSAKG